MLAVTLASTATNAASLNIPSDESDGQLIVTTSTNIDLSLAVTAKWNASNTANKGRGIYDSNEWAVVFKYANVVIAPGATVTFKNHPSRAPVVWLVKGDVTIDGTLSLDGQDAVQAPNISEPGPGGFRGGNGYLTEGVGAGAGFGPGGGNPSGGGSYGTLSQPKDSPTYGNPSLLPLIGGSGGGAISIMTDLVSRTQSQRVVVPAGGPS